MDMSEDEQMALAMRESLEMYQQETETQGRPNIPQEQPYQPDIGGSDDDLQRALAESLKERDAGYSAGGPSNFEAPGYQRHRDVPHYPNPTAMTSDRTKRELRLVFLGMTGVGKSSSANTIIGREEFKADCHGTSITSYCKHANAKVLGRDVVVVDTPGLFDTRQGNDDTMREITRCVCLSAPGPHALILVVRGGDRPTEQVQKCADIIMDVFGDQARRYMIILFTHRDDLEFHQQSLHGFVQTLPSKMKQVLAKCGNRRIAFNNRVRSDVERNSQVKELFAMIDNMVSQNGGRCFTNDVYKDFEKMIVSRERKLKETLEKEKAEELRRVQEKVEKETKRQMKILRDKEHKQAQERERLVREREQQYQRERKREQEREREREMNAWKMKQEEIDREKREMERREREREQRRAREREEERDRQRREEQLNQERQRRLEAEMNSKMNEKLLEQDRRYAGRMDNVRGEIRNEVQRDEQGTGELLVNGLKSLGKGIVTGAKKLFGWFF